MKTRIAALVMAALLALYLVFTINYSTILISSDDGIVQVMGWALLVLPLIGLWSLAAELIFIFRADRLFQRLASDGTLPDDITERRPSGRPDHEAADRVFDRYRHETEEQPDAWQAWLRLGLAYDASGDRKRARWATRHAIKLSRDESRGAEGAGSN